MNKQFVGSAPVFVDLSLDPAEYRGMSIARITREIRNHLRQIAPNASFFDVDVVEAANELASRR